MPATLPGIVTPVKVVQAQNAPSPMQVPLSLEEDGMLNLAASTGVASNGGPVIRISIGSEITGLGGL